MSNPFDLAEPANLTQPEPGRRVPLAYAITGALLLGALLVSLASLFHLRFGPTSEALANAPDNFLLRVAFYQLLSLLFSGVTALLVARFLLEQKGVVDYLRRGPLLTSVLLASLVASGCAGALAPLYWQHVHWPLQQQLGGAGLPAGLLALPHLLFNGLLWLVTVPLVLWPCLHLFRADALRESAQATLSRGEAALLGSLLLALLVMKAQDAFFLALRMDDQWLRLAQYGGVLLVMLACLAGSWLALPSRLQRLRPLALVGASLLTLLTVALMALGGVALLVLWTLTAQPDELSLMFASAFLTALLLVLLGLAQALSLRFAYRPVAG